MALRSEAETESCYFWSRIVCQVAGKLQGLMPGDLGDLGTGSLSYKTLSHLLDLLVQRICTHSGAGDLSTASKAQLELTARLLACAQRTFLVRHEWNELEDPTEDLISEIETRPDFNDYYSLECPDVPYPSCAPSTLAESPFINLILRHIWALAPGSCLSTSTGFASDKATSVYNDECQAQSESQTGRTRCDAGEASEKLMVEALAMSIEGLAVCEKKLVGLLHIVGAAAEVCPLGACWTSNTQNNWRILSTHDDASTTSALVILNGGSSEDLAVVVQCICSILEAYGGHNASLEIQRWTLICLNRLTIATAGLFLASTPNSSGLTSAWRRVWSTLFHPNLCYRSRTKSTLVGSNGDLVLRLLTQIVRFSCTDPCASSSDSSEREALALSIKRQADIWNLPVFEQFDIRNPSAFMLMYVVIDGVGLGDQAHDAIGLSIRQSDAWLLRINECGGGRRSKLVCFCLHYLQQSFDIWKDEAMVSVVFACIAALVNGFSVPSASACISSSTHSLSGDVTLTCLSDAIEDPAVCETSSGLMEVFSSLWDTPLDSSERLAPVLVDDSMDILREGLRTMHLRALTRDRPRQSANTVGFSQSNRLFARTASSLKETLSFFRGGRDPLSVSNDEGNLDGVKMSPSLVPLSGLAVVLKGYLTLLLTRRGTAVLATSFESLSSEVSDVFFLASSGMTSVSHDVDEVAAILSNLVQIVRGLASANCELGVRWPCPIFRGARSLYDACEQLLSNYAMGDSQEEMPSSVQRSFTDNDMLMDDDIPDGAERCVASGAQREAGGESARSKRKLRELYSRRQRRRSVEVSTVAFPQKCSYLLGALLLALNPTCKDCDFVAKMLLGVDELGKSEISEYGVDVWGGIVAVRLICTKQNISRLSPDNPSTDSSGDLHDGSVVSLLCSIIQTIRFTAKPHSRAYLFGQWCCAEIVALCDRDLWSASLVSAEAKDVVEILLGSDLSQERRSFILRPHLRFRQLQAAIMAFGNAAEKFHAEIDNRFGPVFVLPSLTDVSGTVRRIASAAVAAALLVMTEDKVIETVRNRLPPVTGQSTDADLQKRYRHWYGNKNYLGVSVGSCSATESQVWDDAYLSSQHDVIMCWAVIAETSQSREVLQQIMFDLVRLAVVRAGLEGLCFQALERIAWRKGYGSAGNLLDAENGNLSRRWLETGDSLFHVPLMMSSPPTFRRLVRAGRMPLSPSEMRSTKQSGDLADMRWVSKLRDAATSKFLKRGTKYLIPQIIIMSVSTLVQSSITKDGRRRLLENEYLKEYCTVLYDHFDDSAAKKALQSFIPIIWAETLFLRSGSHDESVVADEVFRQMKGLLSDDVVLRKCELGASLALRVLIETIGEASTPVNSETLLESLRAFLKTSGSNAPKRGNDPFSEVGSSAIELLLLVQFHLATSYNTTHLARRWKSFDVVFRLLVDEIGRGTKPFHLSFLIRILTSIILDPKLAAIRIQALRLLQVLIQAAAAVLCAELSAEVEKLMGTILELHRICQHELVATCVALQRGRDKISRYSRGFLGREENGIPSGDVWGWTAEKDHNSSDVCFSANWGDCGRHVSNLLVECLVATYDLLRTIMENGSSYGFGRHVIGRLLYDCADVAFYSALANVNKSFSAQLLIADFLKEGSIGIETDEMDVSSLADRLSFNSTSHTFIRAELAEIERHFQQSRLKRADRLTSNHGTGGENRLVRSLTQFCSKSMTPEIRIAASRCLGEIDLSTYSTRPESPAQRTLRDDRLVNAIASESLRTALQANVVVQLTVSLRNPDPRVAMVAIDTLNAVLSSRAGKECLELIEDPMSTALLQSLVSSYRSLKQSTLFLAPHEIDKLQLWNLNERDDSEERCWDDSFWTPGTNKMTFESWICRLVPALLICCYGIRNSSRTNVKMGYSFFSLFQRISCLDDTIAQALFPALILDMLLQEGLENEQVDLDQVLVDTWIGRCDSRIHSHLSRCFDVLLRNGTDEVDRRVVELVVEVLDILRRLTQERFLSSPNHRRNNVLRSKDARNINGDTSASDEAAPWRGIPFGIVLTLDGKLVANACILARRFEAALFYSELYADAWFGGSNCSLEILALDEKRRSQRLRGTSIKDISGFGLRYEANIDIETDCLAFFQILRCCFAELGEDDARKAVDRQESDFSFSSMQGLHATASSLARDSPSLQQLQLLDNMTHLDRRSVSIRCSVVDCLNGLGLVGALETYINGLTVIQGGMPCRDSDSDALREKSFECRLYAMQWDDSLFQSETSAVRGLAIASTSVLLDEMDHEATRPDQSGALSIEDAGEAGFYEQLVGAMHTIRREDFESSRSHLQAARLLFVNKLASFGTESTGFMNIYDTVDHLQVLNDLDDFVAASGSTEMLLGRFRLRSRPLGESCYSSGSCKSFSYCVREICLRSLRSRSTTGASQSNLTKSLVSHLLAQFESNILTGRRHAADGSLQRLYSLVRSVEESDVLDRRLILVRLRLNEARLFEKRGDFADAIRAAKLSIMHLQQISVSCLEQDVALADALAICGKWMTKYKVEPASSILANYLGPAADIAKAIHGRQANELNTNRATGALLAQGQMVSNLFETLSARVSSLEWQKAETSLNDREKELRSDKLVEDAKKRFSAQSKKKREDPANEIRKELEERQIYLVHLRKEIEATRDQRSTILHSMEAHRALAMQSIVSALKIAGVFGSDDMAKHVYRLVGLWFSSEHNWSESVDCITKDAVHNIPSFRFVPLVTQLFARIATVQLLTASFQRRLQELVSRMSSDHPYHCLIHLITLSEGHSNGSAIETSNEKSQAAGAMLKNLEMEDPEFAAQLIESYKKLTGAYIHLAVTKTSEFNRSTASGISFDKVCNTAALRLDRCLGSGSRKAKYLPCILTQPPSLRPDCDYGDAASDPIGSERIDSFESSFAITDAGVHQPKIVVCIGTNGGRFKQLVKGADDTRQDAVMEQVFGYANELLARERRSNDGETRSAAKYELKIVTYNVVPLNHRAGVRHHLLHHSRSPFKIEPYASFLVSGSRMGRAFDAIWRFHYR